MLLGADWLIMADAGTWLRRQLIRRQICVDYRKLNKVLEQDHFPIPLGSDILDKLSDASIFLPLN